MATSLKRKDAVSVKQYITDKKGRKVAAILDVSELERLEKLIEDLADIRTVKEREAEPVTDYEAYRRRRKSKAGIRLHN